LVVAKFGKTLAVSKQAIEKFDGERFNLRKLNELEVRKQYQIEITGRFAALGTETDGENIYIYIAWENIKENIEPSAKGSLGLQELKQHKACFGEECLCFLDQRKQSKMQWVQDTSQNKVDNVNSVRREASRHFRNKKKECLKDKIVELETNRKIKTIRGLYRGKSDLKKGYHPRIDIVKDGKGDLVADCHSILGRCRNHFSS